MRRGMFLLWLALALALAACTTKSELRFANNTECGAATITLIDTASSQATTHTVGEGETVSLEVVPDALYRYEVTYPRDTTTNRQCEPKTVETRVARGQRINVSLESVPEGAP